MVQGERVELSLPPYQGGVITVILPLHNVKIYGGDGGIRTLAPNKRPISLAEKPL